MMERAKYIKFQGKQILVYDFSNLGTEDALQLMDYCPNLSRNMSPQSIYTLTDVTGLNFNEQLTEGFKSLASHNKPYVIAGAVVGVAAWKKVFYFAALRVSGRKNLKLFDGVEQAKEWLAGYSA